MWLIRLITMSGCSPYHQRSIFWSSSHCNVVCSYINCELRGTSYCIYGQYSGLNWWFHGKYCVWKFDWDEFCKPNEWCVSFYSSWPSDIILRHWSRSALAVVIAWCIYLVGGKLHELIHCLYELFFYWSSTEVYSQRCNRQLISIGLIASRNYYLDQI